MTIKEAIITAIKSERTIAKHIYRHVWISGSTTEVYPITLWHNDVTIQVDTDRNLFERAIKRVVERNADLFRTGYFSKSDGSCPSSITFLYTDAVNRSFQQIRRQLPTVDKDVAGKSDRQR